MFARERTYERTYERIWGFERTYERTYERIYDPTCHERGKLSPYCIVADIGLTFVMCHNCGRNDFPIEYLYLVSDGRHHVIPICSSNWV